MKSNKNCRGLTGVNDDDIGAAQNSKHPAGIPACCCSAQLAAQVGDGARCWKFLGTLDRELGSPGGMGLGHGRWRLAAGAILWRRWGEDGATALRGLLLLDRRTGRRDLDAVAAIRAGVPCCRTREKEEGASSSRGGKPAGRKMNREALEKFLGAMAAGRARPWRGCLLP